MAPLPRLLLLLLLMVLVGGCNSGGGGSGEGGGEAESPGANDGSPESVGQAIGDTYVEAMTELRTMLEPRPAADQLNADIEALHERYVQILVPLGAQREAMDEGDRATVDSTMQRVMWSEAPAEIRNLDWMTEAQSHYRPDDNDLANRIASFNTITQYAVYELLRAQEPAEATRLGVA
ncbi:MAG: hypothetical protein KDA28_06950, partial [Phycisphaerales bacterium]|nr:hypothetical protein [Phycisphaerales bacterium]